ncbi:DUF262 domain-containing protein [Corynebacterium choanae]|uniref:GmrSD restriction endonucleases N-terminal domain-containing protein n=1 Tax=Corynebacterium choanae TaxID=1862358 RepID=A0A3G6J5R0_9CORY|nr:DUF262 domain-containing protein [Corynebacterium choanae]AZA13387.1 hypothetical protein CCHOA_04895 [Corynebacterium choanae]
MAFTTPSYDLIDLFSRVDRGDLQLPDFQRDYSWDIDRIRGLLISCLRGYPIGSFMALDVRNEPSRFAYRVVQGAPDQGVDPGLLLLDGQQRLTTLYHSLHGDGVVDTVDFRNKNIQRKFYVDVDRAVSRTILPDDAIFAVDEQGQVRSHYGPVIEGGITDRNSAIAHGVIPLSELLSDDGTDMLFDIAEQRDERALDRIKQFHNQVLKPLVRYQIPMIRLDRETSRGGVGSIFAQANSAGLQMDIFDLLTAVFAAEDEQFHLAAVWEEIAAELAEYPVLRDVTRVDYLTALTMYLTAKSRGWASGAREDILRIDLQQFLAARPVVTAGFVQAAEFLAKRCMYTADMVPYTSQIIPLAVILALLEQRDPHLLDKQGPQDRLNRWFWSGVFGELYGSAAVISRAGRDVTEVTEWIQDAAAIEDALAAQSQTTRAARNTSAADGDTDTAADADPRTAIALGSETDRVPAPASVRSATFVESRLLSVKADSAVFKGIFALIMGRGAKEWRYNEAINARNFHTMEIGFQHIFPTAYCFNHGIDEVLSTSVLNRTPMSAKTDTLIGETAPQRYLPRLQGKSLLDDAEFDEVLSGHLLDPKLLFAQDAQAFFIDRRKRLLKMVQEAMGREAIRDVDEQDLTGGEEGPSAFRTR